MIRVGFFETNRDGLGQRPDGESRHPPVPGANSRRAAGLLMYRLAGNPARFSTLGETRRKSDL